jgi:hypothetical protein
LAVGATGIADETVPVARGATVGETVFVEVGAALDAALVRGVGVVVAGKALVVAVGWALGDANLVTAGAAPGIALIEAVGVLVGAVLVGDGALVIVDGATVGEAILVAAVGGALGTVLLVAVGATVGAALAAVLGAAEPIGGSGCEDAEGSSNVTDDAGNGADVTGGASDFVARTVVLCGGGGTTVNSVTACGCGSGFTTVRICGGGTGTTSA